MRKFAVAYGRNLDLKRMQELCPHCTLQGKTLLKDWQIAFKRYITLEPCKGATVPVGIWQIDKQGEKELDVIENFPTLYSKRMIEVEFEGKKIETLLYLINDTHPKYPDKGYFNRLLVGYKDFGFDDKYLYDAIARLPQKRVYIISDKVPTNYITACEAVQVSADYGFDIEKIAEYDGVIFPGGGDVDPKFYNQKNLFCKDINTKLDEIKFKAMQFCLDNNKAMLGICLGTQQLNVFFGGSLKQDIPGHKNVVHKVKIEDKIFNDYFEKECEVNSTHHQCIDTLGKDLNVIALSSDGVVEGIRHKSRNILGVQWHPERMQDKRVFEIFKTML